MSDVPVPCISDAIARCRHRILRMAWSAGRGHCPSSLSVLDLLYVLYTRVVGRADEVVLSKGHAALALYAVWAEIGVLKDAAIDTYATADSDLGGHPDVVKAPVAVFSTGSLGHGLSQSLGLAQASPDRKVYCVIGDGELEEGSCWETLRLAPKLKRTNLCVVIDHNDSTAGRQYDASELATILIAMGWFVYVADGHDHNDIERACHIVGERPLAVIAVTQKGRGVPEMEADPQRWHYARPTVQMVNLAAIGVMIMETVS